VTSSTGRTRRTVEVRREEILLAAIAEVERVGLAAVRVSDVAAALGISTGLVFYHFRTKDELVADAFTYAVERDLTAMDRAASRRGAALDRLRAVLRIYGPTGSATGWRLWIDGWALAQHEPVIASHFRDLEAHSRRTLRALVDEGLADASIVCLDPDASVSRLLALLDGLSVAAVVFGSVSRVQLRRWLDGAIAAELGGLDASRRWTSTSRQGNLRTSTHGTGSTP
jgi:AcrR family transcriptional regulator